MAPMVVERAPLGANPADRAARPRHDFDIEPTVSTRSRREVIDAASGGGTSSSSHMSVIVSSTMVRVRVSAMICASRRLPLGTAASCPSGCGCRG